MLFGLSLAVASGEMVTLMGRNGMGKTTTVRSIMGLTPAMAGSIRFDGTEIRALPAYRVAKLGIGLVPGGAAGLHQPHRAREPGRDRRQSRGTSLPWTLDKVCALFPRLAERLPSWATSSPAASSRCWRSVAR